MTRICQSLTFPSVSEHHIVEIYLLILEKTMKLFYNRKCSFNNIFYFSFKIERERKLLVPPPFNVTCLKEYVMNSLSDAIGKTSSHIRDPVGGSYSNWLV